MEREGAPAPVRSVCVQLLYSGQYPGPHGFIPIGKRSQVFTILSFVSLNTEEENQARLLLFTISKAGSLAWPEPKTGSC